MNTSDDGPQLQVDSDWKAQAQAEKARLTQKDKDRTQAPAEESGPAPAGKPGEIPPADFKTLVSSITSQALLAMGAMPDPSTGQRYLSLDVARHHLDSLGVLEEKTKGNLTDEETKLLVGTLYELRSSYVQVANAARSQATGGTGGA